MKQARQLFNPLDDARGWAGTVTIRIEGVNAPGLHGGNGAPSRWFGEGRPLAFGGFDVVTARDEQDHYRIGSDDLLPGDAKGGLPRAAQHLFPTGESDHFGDPMPGGERGIEPLQRKHARAPRGTSFNVLSNPVQPDA